MSSTITKGFADYRGRYSNKAHKLDRQKRSAFVPVAAAPVWHKATPLSPASYGQR